MARASQEIDKWVGRRISELRREAGLSQSALAASLDLSFQQIQKYEAGLNRVSASRLYQLAQLFECAVSDFFPHSEAAAVSTHDTRDGKQHLAMMSAYPRIEDANLRRSVLDIVEALALR